MDEGLATLVFSSSDPMLEVTRRLDFYDQEFQARNPSTPALLRLLPPHPFRFGFGGIRMM